MSEKNDMKLIISPDETPRRVRHRYGYIVPAVISVSALVLAVVLAVGGVLSWFIPQGKNNAQAKITNFSAVMEYSYNGTTYFDLSDGLKISPTGIYTDTTSTVNLIDLRLRIKYAGESSAFIRVKLYESYYNSSSALIPTTATTTYSLASTLTTTWSLESDGYFYYNAPISGTGTTVDFITSGSMSNAAAAAPEAEYFKLVAVIEQVQPDRVETFFGNAYTGSYVTATT